MNDVETIRALLLGLNEKLGQLSVETGSALTGLRIGVEASTGASTANRADIDAIAAELVKLTSSVSSLADLTSQILSKEREQEEKFSSILARLNALDGKDDTKAAGRAEQAWDRMMAGPVGPYVIPLIALALLAAAGWSIPKVAATIMPPPAGFSAAPEAPTPSPVATEPPEP